MNLKNIWLMFIALLVTLVPLKICSVLFTIAFIESPAFLIIFGVASLSIMISAMFTNIKIKNMDITQNIWLGLLSILISAAFFWCISSYFNDTSKYDFEWQPLLMSIFSILCCITFILTSITFFTGKNILAKASFFIFCPILWFALALILFLSIYNNNVDIYEVIPTALLALYSVYHTQVFSTSSNSNIVKLMFVYGLPAVIFTFARCIPVVIKYFRGMDINTVSISTCTLELLMALYIILTLIESYKQLNKSQEPKVRSVTIH